MRIFDSTDVDVACEMLRGLYGRLSLTVSGGRQRALIDREPLGAAELHRIALTMRYAVDAPELRAVMIGRLRGGRLTYDSSRNGDVYVSGDVYLVGQPGDSCRALVDGLDTQVAVLDPALLARTAGTGAVRFAGYRPVSAGAAARWHSAFDYVLGSAGLAAAHPLLADGLSRLLAATALTVFPHDGQVDATPADAHASTLRRAVAFADENAHLPVGVDDMAAAANVTVRTVQLAFRRHLDTTPLAYLRRVRLDHAHRDLLAADPATATVGDIAARWGFPDHSRFTALYRTAYGRAPSATLREL